MTSKKIAQLKARHSQFLKEKVPQNTIAKKLAKYIEQHNDLKDRFLAFYKQLLIFCKFQSSLEEKIYTLLTSGVEISLFQYQGIDDFWCLLEDQPISLRLNNLKQLPDFAKSLNLECLMITGENFNLKANELQSFPNLKRLELPLELKDKTLKINQLGIQPQQLQKLELGIGSYADFSFLNQCENLDSLGIFLPVKNTYTSLPFLKQLPKLRYLRVTNYLHPSIPIEILGQKTLEELYFDPLFVKELPKALFELPALRFFMMQNYHLTESEKEKLSQSFPENITVDIIIRY